MTLDELYRIGSAFAWRSLSGLLRGSSLGVVLLCENSGASLRYAEEYAESEMSGDGTVLIVCRDSLGRVPVSREERRGWLLWDGMEAHVVRVGEGNVKHLTRLYVASAEMEEKLAGGYLIELVVPLGQVVVADPVCSSAWRDLAGTAGIPVVCFVRKEDAFAWYETGVFVARFEPSRLPHPLERRPECDLCRADVVPRGCCPF